jgi:hypothetical protein
LQAMPGCCPAGHSWCAAINRCHCR